MDKLDIKTYQSQKEKVFTEALTQRLFNIPIPKDQLLANLGLFLTSKNLSRILFLDFLYKQIVDVQGVIMDFGTRWGNNMAVFTTLRDIYEPYNRHRKIVGFDTFIGLQGIQEKDGNADWMVRGQLTVPEDYKDYLDSIMDFHERGTALSHIKRYEIIKGDASKEIAKYLVAHPETIIALAYFDFDIYEPTKNCLKAISNHITKGSILAFDELNDPDSPGETIALNEVVGLNNIRLKRYPHVSRTSYFVVE